MTTIRFRYLPGASDLRQIDAMSIRHQLLSLLEDRPLHGYGAQAALVERLGAESAPHAARVYSLLRQLLDDGLVELVAADETSRASRSRAPKHYRITARGKERLDRWLLSPASCSGLLRDLAWSKIAVQMRVDPAGVAAVIAAQIRCDRAWAQRLERELGAPVAGEPWVLRLSRQRLQLHLAAEIASLEAALPLASFEAGSQPAVAAKVPPTRVTRRPPSPRALRQSRVGSGSR